MFITNMDPPLPDDFDPYIGMNAISGGNGNGGRQWLMQLLQGLILAGIVALIGVTWSLQNSVTELRVTLSEREKQNDREFSRIESDIRGIDSRVTTLERGEGAYQPNPNHRQERR